MTRSWKIICKSSWTRREGPFLQQIAAIRSIAFMLFRFFLSSTFEFCLDEFVNDHKRDQLNKWHLTAWIRNQRWHHWSQGISAETSGQLTCARLLSLFVSEGLGSAMLRYIQSGSSTWNSFGVSVASWWPLMPFERVFTFIIRSATLPSNCSPWIEHETPLVSRSFIPRGSGGSGKTVALEVPGRWCRGNLPVRWELSCLECPQKHPEIAESCDSLVRVVK